MRLIASLAVGLLMLSACTSGESDADVDADAEPSPSGRGAAAGAADDGEADGGQGLPPSVAVSTATAAARAAPSGRWTFTTTVDFLDSAVRQSVAATREYDRDARRSMLRVAIDVADERQDGAEPLPSAFGGRSTEVTRIRDDVYIRTTGPGVTDNDWYDLGEAPLEDLLAWNYLFVDPVGERLPLLGFLDDEELEIGAGTVDGNGTSHYPVRFDGETVMASLRQEAPAITGWLPVDLDVDAIDTVAGGTVQVDDQGRLLRVRIDLGPTVRAIAGTVDDEFDRRFYASAEVLLELVFDPDAVVDVAVPDRTAMVPPAEVLEDVPAAELGPGDCLPPGIDLRQAVLPLVDCDAAHTFEVFEVTEGWIDGEPYPGRAEVRRRADELCIDAFAGYVGVPFERSVHSVATISPLPDGWEKGDRTIVCLAESYLPRRGLLASVAE